MDATPPRQICSRHNIVHAIKHLSQGISFASVSALHIISLLIVTAARPDPYLPDLHLCLHNV